MEKENNGNGNTVLLTVIGVATLLVALVGATFAYFSATITNESNESVILTTAAPVGLVYQAQQQIEILKAQPGAQGNGNFIVKNPENSTVAQTYDLDLIIDTNGFSTALWTEADNQTNPKLNNEINDPSHAEALKDQLFMTIGVTSDRTATTDFKLFTDAVTAGFTLGDASKVTSKESPVSAENPLITTATDKVYRNLTDSIATPKNFKIVNDQRIEPNEIHTYTLNLNFAELGIPQNKNQGVNFQAHIDISDPKSVK